MVFVVTEIEFNLKDNEVRIKKDSDEQIINNIDIVEIIHDEYSKEPDVTLLLDGRIKVINKKIHYEVTDVQSGRILKIILSKS